MQDPWGQFFAPDYYPERYEVAGQHLPFGFRGVLDGLQCDQDYLRVLFDLVRGPNRQMCCHYCNCVQWISNTHHHMYNDPSYLYTNFGKEGDHEMLC